MHVRDARLSVIGHRRAQLRPGGPDNHVAAQGVGQLRCQAHAGALACQGAFNSFINKNWLASRPDAPCTLASWAPHNSSRAAATTSSEWGASVASVGERAGVLEAATCGIATLEGVVAQRRRRVRRRSFKSQKTQWRSFKKLNFTLFCLASWCQHVSPTLRDLVYVIAPSMVLAGRKRRVIHVFELPTPNKHLLAHKPRFSLSTMQTRDLRRILADMTCGSLSWFQPGLNGCEFINAD